MHFVRFLGLSGVCLTGLVRTIAVMNVLKRNFNFFFSIQDFFTFAEDTKFTLELISVEVPEKYQKQRNPNEGKI